ncbi:MAG: MmgE/PrpD family protein [Acidimicrobiales bacterium]
MVTTVERIAGWAAGLAPGDVPEEVGDLCRVQRRSVLAAIGASSADLAARRVLAGVDSWAGDGGVPMVGTGRRVRADDAIYAAAALSIALDFDDYLCFGHTGHSAVLVPLLLAAETGATGAEQVLAQLIANEVEARLGGACLLGPQNGQLWSFIHAAGASLAAGRLLGLGSGALAHALALALYQAPRATVPGFMAPDSKLLTAAEPTLVGLRAARLAATGVTGPLDVLDHPQGFLDAFTYAPLPALLDGLGEGWATRTLSIKGYPGCAYVDTTVDALLELGPPPAEEIDSVVVDASVLSVEMDALSRRYSAGGPPSPVTVNFSISWNVAATLVGGRLTPDETNEVWLAEHHTELARLAGAVSLRHDWQLTLRTAEAMMPLLAPRALLARTGGRRAVGALRQVRRDHPGLGFSPLDSLALVRALRATHPSAARRNATARRLWDPEALDAFRMTFPARVRLRMRDGAEMVAATDVPRGGAGNRSATPELVSREKLAAWGPRCWGVEGTEAISGAVDTDADELWNLLGAPPPPTHPNRRPGLASGRNRAPGRAGGP